MEKQINYTTQEAYTGNNADLLQASKEEKGFSSDMWITFCQARDNGMKVKKGEHGTKLNRVLTFTDKKGHEDKKVKRFTVFNIEQTEKQG